MKPTGWERLQLELSRVERTDYAPVRTMMTAMLMLTASSTLPMMALTSALPHNRRISGLS
jgi:hypothetical protein